MNSLILASAAARLPSGARTSPVGRLICGCIADMAFEVDAQRCTGVPVPDSR